jgi:hypothetical protein
MNEHSRGRRGDLEAREAWTARLNRFANARTAKQRDAALDSELKINPGGTIRDLLQAWGYSASARGRKAKGANDKGSMKPARERLELTLDDLFGKKPTPVPSLNPKLAGSTDITVKDAWRIVAALLISWPEKLLTLEVVDTKVRVVKALNLAEIFIRALLSELSAGQSHEWTMDEMEVRIFRLVNEKRVRVVSFINEAGKKEGALIVAGARNVLIGTHPTEILRVFHQLTSHFIDEGHRGILVFVFDAAIFEAGKEGFNLLYNVGLLSTAMTAFALFPENYEYKYPIQQHEVDWSRWRTLSTRCCVAIRKPPLIDPVSGALLKREKLDDFIADWRPEQEFARLDELKGFVRFDSGHVLPRTYPSEFGEAETLGGQDLYWDVLVRPSRNEPDGLDVQYFIPPLQRIRATAESQEGNFENREVRSSSHRGRGRPAVKTKSIEGDFFYVTRRTSPGPYYDDAQRAIYMAARGRLNLDNGEKHKRNLNAAAALRQIGYEVLPISVMLSLFPRALHFAAAMQRISEKSPSE